MESSPGDITTVLLVLPNTILHTYCIKNGYNKLTWKEKKERTKFQTYALTKNHIRAISRKRHFSIEIDDFARSLVKLKHTLVFTLFR